MWLNVEHDEEVEMENDSIAEIYAEEGLNFEVEQSCMYYPNFWWKREMLEEKWNMYMWKSFKTV